MTHSQSEVDRAGFHGAWKPPVSTLEMTSLWWKLIRFSAAPQRLHSLKQCVGTRLFPARCNNRAKYAIRRPHKTNCYMELPSGRDHYDGPGVHQVSVKQSPPPTAVQVGGLDQVGVGVDPEHQPPVGIHRQPLWTDQIYTATPKQRWVLFKTTTTTNTKTMTGLCGRFVHYLC